MENLMRASEEGLIQGLTKLRKNERFCDLVIRCGDRKWNVHRAIVCAQSKFFEKACDGPFKEAIAGEVNLDEENPDMVERLVDFFYTLSYNDNQNPGLTLTTASETAARQAGSLLVNAMMNTLGDVYDIPPLKDLARKRFVADLKTNWASEDLFRSIVVVYTTTPETDKGLRDCVKEMVREHGKELFEKQEFKDAVKRSADFALDVATPAYGCHQPVAQCSYGNCSKTDDSGLRFCHHHRHNIRYY